MFDTSPPPDRTSLTDGQIRAGIRAAEERSRLAVAEQVAWIAEADQRGLAGARFCASTPVLLAQMLLIGRGEAKRRVQLARRVLPRPGLTGELLPAAYPVVGEVLESGSVSGEAAA